MCSLKIDKKYSFCSHKIPLITVASKYRSDQQRRHSIPKLHKLSKYTSVILMRRRRPKIVQVITLEKKEMGGACRAYGGGEGLVQGFDGEAWEKETAGETEA
jgi:hypothetical protein